VSSLVLNGGATVNGAIGYGPNGFVKASVTMAADVEVFLKNTATSTFAQTSTSTNGLYEFTNLPLGDYQIIVNIPGYNQISTYDFTVSDENDALLDLDFLIDNNEIFTSGFMSINGSNNTALTIYPNPTNGELFIELPEVLNNFNLNIYNQLGQSVLNKTISGNNSKSYYTNISEVPNGIYFVTVQNESSKYEIKVVKQ